MKSVHIMVLKPGVQPGKEDVLDRRILIPADSIEIKDHEILITQSDHKKLESLNSFRPGQIGAVMITDNGHRDLTYYKFKGMSVERNKWKLPAKVTFSVSKYT